MQSLIGYVFYHFIVYFNFLIILYNYFYCLIVLDYRLLVRFLVHGFQIISTFLVSPVEVVRGGRALLSVPELSPLTWGVGCATPSSAFGGLSLQPFLF